MSAHKSASKCIATSTIAASARAVFSAQRCLVLVAVCCAAVAWLAGPLGRMLVALPLLLFGPGFLLERTLRPIAHPSPYLLPPFWLGLSLSAIALLYQWITAIGLSLTNPVLTLLVLGCGLGVIVQLWHAGATASVRLRLDPWMLALVAVLALTIWTRVEEVRALVLPNWVDSVHHALMIRVAAERGQAPLDLRPYLPITELPYHWGYHVFVATLLRLAGSSLPQTMLWSGQALNVLHVLTVAGLAVYLWRRPMAGIAAAITVGLISIMPAYYVSWGRYTQLTGLLLVAPIAIAWLELLRAPHWRLVTTLALLLAGLSLIHFIVLLYALMFLAASGSIWLVRGDRVGWASIRAAGSSAGLALLITAPWLLVLVRRKLLPNTDASALPLLGGGTFNALDLNLLWAGQNRLLIALALAVALWAIWRRRAVAAMLLGWLGLLIMSANPWMVLYLLPAAGGALALSLVQRRRWGWAAASASLLLLNPAFVKLPYLSLLTNEAVVISLFLPLGLLIGGGAAWLWDALAPRPIWGRVLVALALAALACWGSWKLRDVVNPRTVLARPGDVSAIEWVATHTAPDARFLVNTAGWLRTGRGSDGGWWILPLTGRWVSAPPVIYDYAAPAYVQAVRARNAIVSGFKPGREQQLYDMIDREQITYVYLSSADGPLTPSAFPAAAGFEQVYARDGVSIFAVHRGGR